MKRRYRVMEVRQTGGFAQFYVQYRHFPFIWKMTSNTKAHHSLQAARGDIAARRAVQVIMHNEN